MQASRGLSSFLSSFPSSSLAPRSSSALASLRQARRRRRLGHLRRCPCARLGRSCCSVFCLLFFFFFGCLYRKFPCTDRVTLFVDFSRLIVLGFGGVLTGGGKGFVGVFLAGFLFFFSLCFLSPFAHCSVEEKLLHLHRCTQEEFERDRKLGSGSAKKQARIPK